MHRDGGGADVQQRPLGRDAVAAEADVDHDGVEEGAAGDEGGTG